MDFDGDTAATYIVHDQEALKQMYQNAWLGNVTNYDGNNNFLATIRHEALYAAYCLTYKLDPKKSKLKISSLNELPIDLKYFNDLTIGIKFKDQIYTYGILLLNKLAGFQDVKINQVITKKQVQLVSKLIFEDSKNSLEYTDRISNLEKQLMFFITVCDSIPSLNLEEMIQLVDEDAHKLLQQLPEGNAYLCYHIINALIDRCVSSASDDLGLIKLFKSGSRFSKEQLSKFCIVTGLISDENSIVDQNPIRNSLIDGLTEEMFFASAPGSRKGKQYTFLKFNKFYKTNVLNDFNKIKSNKLKF